MRRLLAVVAIGLAGACAAAQDGPPRERAAALLERGNTALARGMDEARGDKASRDAALREAAAAYGTVLDGGLDGPALRLNLASAQAQLGDRGLAALHLRAAGRLAMDRDDERALRAADAAFRSLRPGAGASWPPTMMERGSRTALTAAHSAGPATLAGVFLGCWGAGWLLLGLRAGGIGPRTPLLVVGGLLVVGAASGGLLAWASAADAQASALGVVVQEGVTARAGPGDAFESVAATAGAGSDVRVLDERDGWVKARLSAGAEVWLPAHAVVHVGAVD